MTNPGIFRQISLLTLLGLTTGLTSPALLAQAKDEEKTKEASQAATQEEVDVSTRSMGASTKGDGKNLDAVLEGQKDSVAELIPKGSGAAETMVKLAGPATISRVMMKFTPALGRLIIVGVKSDDEKVDLSDLRKVGNLISTTELDGTQRTLSFDVSKLTVRAVKIFWIPQVPDTPLLVEKIGIFTREKFVPDGDSMIAGAQAAPGKPATPVGPPSPLPPAVLPNSKPVSY